MGPLTALLDSGEKEEAAVAVIGLSKLLLHGRISSPRLLARLVLLWFEPTDPDAEFDNGSGWVEVRAHLAAFLGNYGLMSREHQQAVAAALEPALQMFIAAPGTSRLCLVEPANILDFFVRVTDAAQLGTRCADDDVQVRS